MSAPVTFGILHPVILLPRSFRELPATQQDAVLCHEILHVRRKDWIWMLGEEFVRSLLWFHPAIWWLTAEIRLTREEVVDADVILFTRTKDEYVDALLCFASVGGGPFSTVAPGFMRRHHLHHRISSILKGVSMSRTRYISTVFAATTALAAVCWLITNTVPLNAAPQLEVDAPGITVDTAGAALLHRTPVAGPGVNISGTVVMQLKVDQRGNVIDASVLSGPEELRKAVLQSVLNWHFAPGAGSLRQVSVTFRGSAIEQVRATSGVRDNVPNSSSHRHELWWASKSLAFRIQ
ncbi:MAG: TonB family protein [Bryobacterales bacterium]|nr:TonB family protein [Bryobacterales bacterium]